ncbi:MAG: glycosyltransferase [Myxococcales bacterium]|nr:glycosyltransferase [Myxococcales bacterium]
MSAGFLGGATLLMSVYARDTECLFRRALASALDTEDRLDQAIVVVDGPLGAELERVLAVYETRADVEILRIPQNVGLASALNEGLARVKTEWVVRADADDLNVPERFAMQADFSRRYPNVSCFGGAIDEYAANGAAVARRTVPLLHEDIVRRARARNPFNHMTVAYRVDAVRAVGGYPNLYLREDYGLWALLIRQGVLCANLPQVLVHASAGRELYRRRGGWRYAIGEWSLQKHLVRCGVAPPLEAFFHGAIRFCVFALPPRVRGFVYESLLRGSPR